MSSGLWSADRGALTARSGPSDCRRDFLGIALEHIGFRLDPGMRAELDAAPPRDNMEMQMENDLPAGPLIVLKNGHTIRLKRQFYGGGNVGSSDHE